MTLALLVLGCATNPWTAETAFEPTLNRLDLDGDGRVNQAEYDRVAFSARPFAQVDTDADGALSVTELSDLFYGQDPFQFFAAQPSVRSSRPEPGPDRRVRTTVAWRTLESLREELAAAAPGAVLPDDARIADAATAGLASGPGVAVLTELRSGYTAAGLAWPAGLLPETPR